MKIARRVLHSVLVSNGSFVTWSAKLVLKVGLRGKAFDPLAYQRWRRGSIDPAVNPYVHAALFGIAETLRSFRGSFGKIQLRPDYDQSRKWALVATHDMSRTGAPILALNLVTELKRQKYNVAVLALGDGELSANFTDEATLVIRDFGLRNGTSRIQQRLESLSKECSFEFAVVNSIESGMVVSPLANLKIPVVFLIHEFVAYSSQGAAIVHGLNDATALIFSTELTRQNMRESGLVNDPSKMYVLPQGKSEVPPSFSTSNDRRNVEEFRGVVKEHFGARKSTRIRVLGAGYVQYRKGVDLFIEAAKIAKEEFPELEIKFAWIGDGYSPLFDRAYSVYIEDQIQRSGLIDDFVIWNASDDFDWLLQEVDVFCLSSRLDPLPNVAIDALFKGLPVVCFDKASGIAELLSESKALASAVVPYLDSAMLGRAIPTEAMRVKSEREYTQKIRAKAKETFSMRSYVRSLIEFSQGTTR